MFKMASRLRRIKRHTCFLYDGPVWQLQGDEVHHTRQFMLNTQIPYRQTKHTKPETCSSSLRRHTHKCSELSLLRAPRHDLALKRARPPMHEGVTELTQHLTCILMARQTCTPKDTDRHAPDVHPFPRDRWGTSDSVRVLDGPDIEDSERVGHVQKHDGLRKVLPHTPSTVPGQSGFSSSVARPASKHTYRRPRPKPKTSGSNSGEGPR